MKCCSCCDYGPILSDEALNDRLYWVEIVTGKLKGAKCAAWRDRSDNTHPWLVSVNGQPLRMSYADDEIRIIHEIIPEE